MDIKIKTLKFEAGEKLLAFVEKKVARLEKFVDDSVETVEVSLEDCKDGKKVKIQIHAAGNNFIVDRAADTFENAVTLCVDLMKEQLTRAKEKKEDR